jgi:F-type H+-transporting ATPase subunit delta
VATETTGHDGLADRYAAALYELADESGKLDEVAQDLSDLGALIREVPDLARVIASPFLSRAEQGKAIEAVLAKIGTGDLVRRFVGVAAANRRLNVLPQLISAFLAKLAGNRGEIPAEVTSAKKLTAAQTKALLKQLQGSVGAKVVVTHKVDESLIGGIVVRVGSKMIDNSLKSKLARLQLVMKGIA